LPEGKTLRDFFDFLQGDQELQKLCAATPEEAEQVEDRRMELATILCWHGPPGPPSPAPLKIGLQQAQQSQVTSWTWKIR
jgi:hypothetical protein